jgi:hypothetical protein
LDADKYLEDLDIRFAFSRVRACPVTFLCILNNYLPLTLFLPSHPEAASLAGYHFTYVSETQERARSPTLKLAPTLNQFSAYIRNRNPAIFLLKSDGADYFSSSQSELRPCQCISQLLAPMIRFFLTHICTVVNNISILSVCPTKSALNLTKSSFLHSAHLIFIHPSLTLLPLPPVLKLAGTSLSSPKTHQWSADIAQRPAAMLLPPHVARRQAQRALQL